MTTARDPRRLPVVLSPEGAWRLLDDARRLVAQDGRHRPRVTTGDNVEVAAADATGGGPNQNLVGFRVVDLDAFDAERRAHVLQNGGLPGGSPLLMSGSS